MAWRYGIYKSRGILAKSLANRKFTIALNNTSKSTKIRTGIIVFNMELVSDDCVESLEKQSAYCKESYEFFKQQSALNSQSKHKKMRELGKKQRDSALKFLKAFRIFSRRLQAIKSA